MPERCPKCGSEMEWEYESDFHSGGWWSCARCLAESREDPKDCRISELERQLEEARAVPKPRTAICLWCGFTVTAPPFDDDMDTLAKMVHEHLGHCDASPVPALQRDLEEAQRAHGRSAMEAADLSDDVDAFIKEREKLLLRLRESQLAVVALREALARCMPQKVEHRTIDDAASKPDFVMLEGNFTRFKWASEALSNTSATAQQVRAEIERKALDDAEDRVIAATVTLISDSRVQNAICAAIRGETMDALPRRTPPPGCDRGWMMNQNMPNTLKVGWHADHTLPPGTIEFWQDGKLVGRIDGIGLPSKEK